MKFFITLSKRNVAVILALITIALLIFVQAYSKSLSKINGSTNSARVDYLKSLSFDINDEFVSSKEVTIPQNFDNTYKDYNHIQKKGGFDLLKYKGKSATVYTYNSVDNKYHAHLIVFNGNIIGGDISEAKLGGEIKPLKNILIK